MIPADFSTPLTWAMNQTHLDTLDALAFAVYVSFAVAVSWVLDFLAKRRK